MKCNRKELADILGRDVKTIDKMVYQGMPYFSRPGENGARKWVFESADAIAWTLGTWDDDKFEAAKTRLLVAEAQLKEIAYLRALGLVWVPEEALPPLDEALAIAKSLFVSIPSRMALLVAYETDEQKIVDVLTHEVEAALKPLDDYMSWFNDEIERRKRRAATLLLRQQDGFSMAERRLA
jgi:hypothetical protein